jgi:hypothetical protein
MPQEPAKKPERGQSVDFVDQFRRLVRLLLKWALIAVVVVAALGGATAAGIHGWEWWSHDRHVANVQIGAIILTEICTDPAEPLAILIKNDSTKTIEHTRFRFTARRPGRSTDIADRPWWSDRIIKPGESWAGCLPPMLSSPFTSEDPLPLEWGTRAWEIRFAD